MAMIQSEPRMAVRTPANSGLLDWGDVQSLVVNQTLKNKSALGYSVFASSAYLSFM